MFEPKLRNFVHSQFEKTLARKVNRWSPTERECPNLFKYNSIFNCYLDRPPRPRVTLPKQNFQMIENY